MLMASVLHMLPSGRSKEARNECPPHGKNSFVFWHILDQSLLFVSSWSTSYWRCIWYRRCGCWCALLSPPLSGIVTTVWLEVFILSVSEMSQSRMVCIKHTPKLDLPSPHVHIKTTLLVPYLMVLAHAHILAHYIKLSWSQRTLRERGYIV